MNKKSKLPSGILAIMAITGLLILNGCAKKDVMPAKIRIASGGTSGTYYAYGTAIGEVIQKKTNIPVIVRATGGSVENIQLLKLGQVDVAFVQTDIMSYAYNGTNLFSTEGEYKDMSAVAALYPEVCQIVAGKDIEGISNLKGKRVSLGDQGSGTELNALQILEAYGIAETDIAVEHLGFGASVAAMEAGRIDAFFCTAGIPTPAISSMAASGRIHLLSIGEARARVLMSAYPFYAPVTIRANTYPGIDEETSAVAVQATLVTATTLSNAAVSQLLTILFENKDEIANMNSNGAGFDRTTAVAGVTIPLHPGAAQFFRSK
jgi:TRAP transporter TAXI family solute receptor